MVAINFRRDVSPFGSGSLTKSRSLKKTVSTTEKLSCARKASCLIEQQTNATAMFWAMLAYVRSENICMESD